MQDAAASLPARLLGDVRGLAVADLCAAPGGKTAQLAFAGARVTAVDRSAGAARPPAPRISRGLRSTPRPSPPTCWNGRPAPFDAVLLDAPCSSTGTIRRHPDVPWLKSEADIAVLTALQQRLLDRAVELLKPGGMLVYCVCSLEPEEGERADRRAAGARPARSPASRLRRRRSAATPNSSPRDGDLRTLPLHLPDPDPRWGGLDGFYAARLDPPCALIHALAKAYWPCAGPSLSWGSRARIGPRRRGRAP